MKEHIQGQAHFKYYRDGSLWYETDSGFLFPVPAEEVGTATFNRDDKAIMFMRWIRKWREKLETAKTEAMTPDA